MAATTYYVRDDGNTVLISVPVTNTSTTSIARNVSVVFAAFDANLTLTDTYKNVGTYTTLSRTWDGFSLQPGETQTIHLKFTVANVDILPHTITGTITNAVDGNDGAGTAISITITNQSDAGANNVSADADNNITAGTDGGAYLDVSDVVTVVSADVDNDITAGTDGGAYLDVSDIVTVVSTDTDNLIIAGTDGGAFYELPYKVYVASVDQAGTANPTATVLQNTLSGVPAWTRANLGEYHLTLAAEFPTTNKLFVTTSLHGNSSPANVIIWENQNVNSLQFFVLDEIQNPSELEGKFVVEIRVYP